MAFVASLGSGTNTFLHSSLKWKGFCRAEGSCVFVWVCVCVSTAAEWWAETVPKYNNLEFPIFLFHIVYICHHSAIYLFKHKYTFDFCRLKSSCPDFSVPEIEQSLKLCFILEVKNCGFTSKGFYFDRSLDIWKHLLLMEN